jgi:hypothetical protein
VVSGYLCVQVLAHNQPASATEFRRVFVVDEEEIKEELVGLMRGAGVVRDGNEVDEEQEEEEEEESDRSPTEIFEVLHGVDAQFVKRAHIQHQARVHALEAEAEEVETKKGKGNEGNEGDDRVYPTRAKITGFANAASFTRFTKDLAWLCEAHWRSRLYTPSARKATRSLIKAFQVIVNPEDVPALSSLLEEIACDLDGQE